MSIFVDTANIDQAKAAKEFGWVRGITTNPILLAKSEDSAADTLLQLAELNTGLLFYQLMVIQDATVATTQSFFYFCAFSLFNIG